MVKMARRELYTIRIDPVIADRYRSWCSVVGVQMADGVEILMTAAGVPTLGEMRAFMKITDQPQE